MTRDKLHNRMTKRELQMSNEAMSRYTSRSALDIEGIAHEVAHGVLLFKHFASSSDLPSEVYNDNDIQDRCKKMTDSRAREHEITTLALEMRGLQVLGHPQSLRRAIDISYDATFSATKNKYKSKQAIARGVRTRMRTISKRTVQRFVDVYWLNMQHVFERAKKQPL